MHKAYCTLIAHNKEQNAPAVSRNILCLFRNPKNFSILSFCYLIVFLTFNAQGFSRALTITQTPDMQPLWLPRRTLSFMGIRMGTDASVSTVKETDTLMILCRELKIKNIEILTHPLRRL